MTNQYRRHFRSIFFSLIVLVVVIFGQTTRPGRTQNQAEHKVVQLAIVPTADETVVGDDLSLNVNVRGDAQACPTVNSRPPLDVVLVLDHSGSMYGDPMRNAKDAVLDFINLLDPKQDRFGLVIFNHTTYTITDLTSDFNRVINRLQTFDAGGATNIGLALHRGQQLLSTARPGSQKAVVLFTDGVDTAGFFARASAEKIKQAGIPLITIGFGEADPITLSELATSPSDFVFAPSTAQLKSQFARVANELVSRVAARNVVVTFHPNTKAYALESSVISSSAVSNSGEIEWHLPILTDDKQVSLPVVLRSLQSGQEPLGTADVSYDSCTDGQSEKADLPELPQIKVNDKVTQNSLFLPGNNLPFNHAVNSLLQPSGQQGWLVNVPASQVVSVWLDGAGASQAPSMASNEEFGISPLYSLRNAGQNGQTLNVFKLNDSGPHWLYVQSRGTQDSGRYTVRLEENAAISADSLPQLDANNSVEFKQDTEGKAVHLDVAGGQRITINTKYRVGYGYVKVFDSQSVAQPLQSSDYDYNTATESDVFNLSSKGPFILVVQPDFSYSPQASYVISIGSNSISVNKAGDLELGKTVHGNLSLESEDAWSFTGKAGDIIQGEISNANFGAKLTLRNPAGEIIALGQDTKLDTVKLPEDGTYTLAVDAQDKSSGSYSLLLKEATFDNPGEITSGKSYTNEIDAGGNAAWTFTAKAGDAFSGTITPADFNLSLDLLNPKGDVISHMDTAAGYDATFQGFVLDDAGTYTLRIQGTTPTEKGHYRIAYNSVEAPQTLAVFSRDNQPAGNLTAGKSDLWQFQASEGDSISITAQSSSAQIYLELLDPQGEPMADSIYSGYAVSLKRITAPKTGRYVLVVAGYSATDAGGYTLKYTPELSDLGLVGVGETVKGSNSGAISSYEVRADSGQTITVVLKTPFSTAYPFLVDGSGNSIVPDNSVTATRTTVLVYTLSGTAPYRLYFRMNGRFELNIGDGNTILSDQGTLALNTAAKGRTTDFAKIVTYKLDASSGDTVSVQLDTSTPRQRNPMQITDSDGQIIAALHSQQLNTHSVGVYKLDGNAPFVLSVAAEDSYTLNASSGDVIEVQKGNLDFDQKVTSKVVAPAQFETYNVNAKAGQIITFELQQTSGKDIVPSLTDDQGSPIVPRRLVKGSQGMSYAVYQVANDGVYSLTLQTQGNYTVTLKDGDSTQVQMDALPSSVLTTGQLKTGQRALYPLDVKAGDDLLISVINSRLNTIDMSLVDSKNHNLLIASELTPAQFWSFSTTPAGEGPYTLVLQIEGKYQLMVMKKADLQKGLPFSIKSNTPLRAGPGGNFNVVGSAAKNANFSAFGRDADGKWVMVLTPDNRLAWVDATKAVFTDASSDVQSLPEIKVVDTTTNK